MKRAFWPSLEKNMSTRRRVNWATYHELKKMGCARWTEGLPEVAIMVADQDTFVWVPVTLHSDTNDVDFSTAA